MKHQQTNIHTISALLAVSSLSLLAGCGGGSGVGKLASQQPAVSDQPFTFGSLTGRAAISNPPITTNSNDTTITGLKGTITALTMTDTTPNLAETRIAFSNDRDGNNEIYVMNADGSNQTRLTNNSAEDLRPSWSPDGSKIAFESTRDGNYEIYVMRADGSAQTRLTNNSADDSDPNWSPDGTKIAFTSNRNGNNEIYVMSANGSAQTRLTNSIADDKDPSWSPDSRKIVFTSARNGNNEIYVMNADGSNQTRLTNNSADDRYPSWSPDGTKIAFTSTRDNAWEVYVMHADGMFPTRLTYSNSIIRNPSWSPDGSKVIYDKFNDSSTKIFAINSDGSGETRLTNNVFHYSTPSWSPFVTQRTLIGSGGALGANASGFLFSQQDEAIVSVFTFSAVTPSSVVLTSQTGINNIGRNLVFSIDADQLSDMSYVNSPDFQRVKLTGLPSSGANQPPPIVGALVSYSAKTGRITAVLPFSGGRAAGSKPSLSEESGTKVFRGRFTAVWDGAGKNLAPKGASEVRLNLASDTLTVH